MASPPRFRRIELIPAAVQNGGTYYGTVEFRLAGRYLGPPRVLRDTPCRTVAEAVQAASHYIAARNRH
jgi:hypothetical protein